MSSAFALLTFIGTFALGIGLYGLFISASNKAKVKLHVEHENRQLSSQPWDVKSSRDRGNR